jgi:hypothetical protein
MFRLHIDVPLFEEETVSAEEALRLTELIKNLITSSTEIRKFNYRLMNDDDRGAKNYLLKDANGHCSNNKCKVSL